MNKNKIIGLLVFTYNIIGCSNGTNTNDNEINDIPNVITYCKDINYNIVKTYKHDTSYFTEGLTFKENILYESTGSPSELLQTNSAVYVYDSSITNSKKIIEIDKQKYFGEGIAFYKDLLFQLTYQNQLCFVYDKKFKMISSYKFSNKEGWGLCLMNNTILMSDGTNTLTFLNPQNFSPTKTIFVTENGSVCDKLNEIEFIDGYIYANIWLTNNIVKIDPSNGKVVGKLNLTKIVDDEKRKNPNCDVLNGIAYNCNNKKIFITGKLWSSIYEITIMD
jgi:glutamine cyclotransferase